MKKEEISLKNTKAEILEALNEALQREKEASKAKFTPEKEEKEKKEKKAVENSRENIKQNIFSEELVRKFKELELAIEVEENKLKELYDIEKEMNQLTLIINAGKDFVLQIEERKKAETNRFNQMIKELEEEYKIKSETLKKEYDLNVAQLKKERERETEEYNYKTKREREISNNKWEDEKKVREKTLANMEEETKELLENAKGKEKYLKELETKVSEIGALLEKEYTRGKEEAQKELTKENTYTLELLKKDFQNTIDRQTDKINSLEAELEKEQKLNKILQEKTDKAYLEMKDLATRTVETSGGLKIIGNTANESK